MTKRNPGEITVKKVIDMQMEGQLVESDDCDFAVSERDGTLYISTKLDHESFQQLPGWKTLLNGGLKSIKRFSVIISTPSLLFQLERIYPGQRVLLVE